MNREERKQHDRRRFEQLAASANLRKLHNRTFRRMLMTACREDLLPAAFRTEAVNRLKEQRLKNRDLFRICIESPKSPAWDSLRRAAVKSLLDRPKAVESIFQIGSELFGWGRLTHDLKILEHGESAHFICVAAQMLSRNRAWRSGYYLMPLSGGYEGFSLENLSLREMIAAREMVKADGSRNLKQLAAIDVLLRIMGWEPRIFIKDAAKSYEEIEPQMGKPSELWKRELRAICRSRGWAFRYHTRRIGDSHPEIFESEVRIKSPRTIVSLSQRGRTAIEAERRAAQSVMDYLDREAERQKNRNRRRSVRGGDPLQILNGRLHNKDALRWRIEKLEGGRQFLISAKIAFYDGTEISVSGKTSASNGGRAGVMAVKRHVAAQLLAQLDSFWASKDLDQVVQEVGAQIDAARDELRSGNQSVH